MARAAAFFAYHGIARIERVMSDNALNYRRSHAFRPCSPSWAPATS